YPMGGEAHPQKFTHGRLTYASEDGYPRGLSDPEAAAHFARHDPARVLREVKAKQAVMAEHRPHDHRGEHGDATFCDACQWDHGDDSPRIDNHPAECFGQNPCRTLAALASVYADLPDYDPDWLT